jgi:hypothetical protein
LSDKDDIVQGLCETVRALSGRELDHDNATAIAHAIYEDWHTSIDDLAATGEPFESSLRVPGTSMILRVHKAWWPLVSAAAYGVSLVLTGGATLPAGISLAESVRAFVKAFVRIMPADQPVFAALYEANARSGFGGDLGEIVVHLPKDASREATLRSLERLEQLEVIREKNGRWFIRL